MDKIALDIAVGVFSGLVANVVQAWSAKLEQLPGETLQDFEARRSIDARLHGKIVDACRKLPEQDANLVAELLKDEQTVNELTRLVAEGRFDADAIATILPFDSIDSGVSSKRRGDVAVALQNTFDECVAKEEFAGHYTMIRQLRMSRQQTSEVRASTGRIARSRPPNPMGHWA